MNRNEYAKLIKNIDTGKSGLMLTELIPEGEELKKYFLNEETSIAEHQGIFEKGLPKLIKNPGNITYLAEPYLPEPHLVIFGGGHISQPLADFAYKADFNVTVVDDRESFANIARFPNVKKIICDDFKRSFNKIDFNKTTFVVIVTRGHRHDLECLRESLRHDTAYVGMIGSKRRVKETKALLVEEGYDIGKLDEVCAPIGLDIGAVTPVEIAFSIVAQLIKFRRSNKNNWPELDYDVISELSSDDDLKRAVVTIVNTKGSVPRNAGAKMVIREDGVIFGSIGGGCSEGEVIQIAKGILKKGGFKYHTVDMTGDIAEEEGMACGGIMEVLIESYR